MRVQNRYDDMFFINTLVNVLVCRVINDRVKDGNNSFEIVPAFVLLNEEATLGSGDKARVWSQPLTKIRLLVYFLT